MIYSPRSVYPIELRTEPERRILRTKLEIAVQNRLGPIANIGDIDTPSLYGMRDNWNNRRAALTSGGKEP